MAMTPEEKHVKRLNRLRDGLLKIDGRIGVNGRSAKSKAINDVAKLFQKLVRLRAADSNGVISCVLCGKRTPFNSQGMHGGHRWSRGGHSATIFDERNVAPCCWICNSMNSGNIKAYDQWLDFRYPASEVQSLRLKAKQVKSWGYDELAGMKIVYLDQIKIESKRIENGEPPSERLLTLTEYESGGIEF